MKKTLLVILGVMGVAGWTSVQAQLIDVQFNDDSINLIYDGGAGSPSPLPVMSGTAVIGSSAGDIWNQITAANLTYANPPLLATTISPVALNYVNGAASGVSLTLSAPNGTYNANSAWWGNYSPFTTAGSPYSPLMQSCLVANSAAGNGYVTLSGLTPLGTYSLITYNASDENETAGRTSSFTVNGVTQTSTYDGVTSTLVNGVDYLVFAGVTADAGGNLTINFGNLGVSESDFNGFQLQGVNPVPEPSTFALVGAGMALLLGYQRRKALRA